MKFDSLLTNSGWLEIQQFIAEQIDTAIFKAANDDPLKAEEQRLHVIQWNAKRELNDSALQYIDATRKERDRILETRREEEKYRQYVSSTYDTY